MFGWSVLVGLLFHDFTGWWPTTVWPDVIELWNESPEGMSSVSSWQDPFSWCISMFTRRHACKHHMTVQPFQSTHQEHIFNRGWMKLRSLTCNVYPNTYDILPHHLQNCNCKEHKSHGAVLYGFHYHRFLGFDSNRGNRLFSCCCAKSMT